MKPKNTICIWFDNDAQDAARFYAVTFPDSKVIAVHQAPGDYPGGKKGDVLTVEFTVLGIPCLGLNGRPRVQAHRGFPSRSRRTIRKRRDRYWNAIIGNGARKASAVGARNMGLLLADHPARANRCPCGRGAGEAKRLRGNDDDDKIDIAAIETARRG